MVQPLGTKPRKRKKPVTRDFGFDANHMAPEPYSGEFEGASATSIVGGTSANRFGINHGPLIAFRAATVIDHPP